MLALGEESFHMTKGRTFSLVVLFFPLRKPTSKFLSLLVPVLSPASPTITLPFTHPHWIVILDLASPLFRSICRVSGLERFAFALPSVEGGGGVALGCTEAAAGWRATANRRQSLGRFKPQRTGGWVDPGPGGLQRVL